MRISNLYAFALAFVRRTDYDRSTTRTRKDDTPRHGGKYPASGTGEVRKRLRAQEGRPRNRGLEVGRLES